jgi:hypothetical protein
MKVHFNYLIKMLFFLILKIMNQSEVLRFMRQDSLLSSNFFSLIFIK